MKFNIFKDSAGWKNQHS